MNRYEQQIRLSQFGWPAQHLLQQAKILLVGMGGLGCPCASYLVAAGVGKIILCDGDEVSLSNLHRQILFTEQDLGMKKVVVAQQRLQAMNSEVNIQAQAHFLEESNILSLVSACDIVVDCTDNYATRFLLSEAAAALHIPYVFAANFQYEGQLALFNHIDSSCTLKQIFPDLVKEPENCAQRGALGPILGILGSLQALETMKWIVGMSDCLDNQLLLVDGMNYSMERFSFGKKRSLVANHSHELSAKEFIEKIKDPNVLCIDVRQANEKPSVDFPHRLIPLSELGQQAASLPRDKEIILFCHSGIRSADALDLLEYEFHFEHVKHLKGGIIKYFDFLQSVH